MRAVRRFAVLCTAAALLAGCAGASQSATPPLPVTNAAAGAPPASAFARATIGRQRSKGTLTIRIRIPKKRHHHGRGPRYISAATKGMTMAFTGPSTSTQVVNLTPSDSRCVGSPLVCTIAVTLLAGSYTVTVDTYDQAPISGAIPAGAKLLSTAKNVAFTMTGGITNQISIALDGVPAALSITGLPAATPGTPFSAPKNFTVTARDAGGFVIVGTYSEPVTLTDSDTTGATVIATAGSDSPPNGELLSSSDTATIDYNGSTISPATITATAAGATSGLGVFGVAEVVVADSGNGLVKEIPPGCTVAGCVITLGGGFARPYGAAIDGGGNVYVSDVSTNLVSKIPPGCVTAGCVTTIGGGFSYPSGVAVDGSGNVFVGDELNSAVKEIPPGCVTATCVTTLGGGFGGPSGLAVDGSGNVFVADFTRSAVFKIPTGCVTALCVVTLGGGFTLPYGAAVDGLGNVFVAGNATELVSEIPAGCVLASCVTTIGGGFTEPAGVAVDTAGDVFATDFSNNTVKEIPPGCVTSLCVTTIGGGFNEPLGIAVP